MSTVDIMIVDDSPIIRQKLTVMLEQIGYRVVQTAATGKEAIAAYRNQRPDLVTMDITMREMDGFEAAREIRAIDPEARIIFLSNLDEDKYSEDVKRLGALGYVNKHNARAIIELIGKL